LREAIYALAVSRIAGEAPPTASLTALNRIAAGEPATPRLGRDGKLRLVGSAGTLLTTLAREAVRLFGGEQADRIRQCESETCALLFLDLSRSGDRRWCSMSGCGNRAKVAEFRRRKRAEPA
jgi:predicted RNA-binding Zn ribbon-like protein